MGGLHFLKISSVVRSDLFLEPFWEGLGEGFGRVLGVVGSILGFEKRVKFLNRS